MKFRHKVFTLTIATYIITLALTSIFITEGVYARLLQNEVNRALSEESNTHAAIYLYLWGSLRTSEERLSIELYADTIGGLFASPDTYMELLTTQGDLLASNFTGSSALPRGEEIVAASKGQRSYVLRRLDGIRYLVITDTLNIEGEKMLLTLIKDLSAVEQARIDNYLLFLRFGLLGLCVAGGLGHYLAKVLVKPVEDLTHAALRISTGNYHERVSTGGKDEVGELAAKFNIMAKQVETHVHELHEESQRKERFVNNLTHELRTPLTSVIGYAEMLQRIQYNEQTFVAGLTHIQSEGQRMLRLIHTLMELITTREFQMPKSPCALLPMLNEVAEIVAPKAKLREVKVIVEGPPATLTINSDLIKGAVLNLVDNALNASLPGTSVHLCIKDEAGNVVIEVRDAGAGIPQEALAKIFEPFYRVDVSRSRKTGGLGLGLNLVKEIVDKHGASLKIKSELGQGTVARIHF